MHPVSVEVTEAIVIVQDDKAVDERVTDVGNITFNRPPYGMTLFGVIEKTYVTGES